MYPTEVLIDEKAIERLTKTYKTAYKEILDEIEGATDFGVYNRKILLAQIEKTLTELGTDTQAFIEETLPEYYKSGADDAIAQLKTIDAPIRVGTGFSKIHNAAITALVSDTAKAFGESLTGVNRSANNIIGKIAREEITQRLASGQIKGEALRDTKATIVGTIRQQGLDALIDKGGHKWTLDRYSEMLIRTKSVEARNRGLINRLVENSFDLVQVSSHGAEDQCGRWEGKILSMTGATKSFQGEAIFTLAQAEDGGLFHPNCKHAINILRPEIASLTQAYNPNEATKYIDPSKVKQETKKKAAPTKTMTFVGNEIKLSSLESKIAEEKNLKIIELKGRTANRVYGQYNPTFNTIGYGKATLSRSAALNNQTFFHEIGHMVDNHALPKDIVKRTYASIPTNHQVANYLSKQPEFIEAVAPYKYDIIETRLKRGNESWQKLDSETIKTIVQGGKVPVKGTTNRYYYLTPTHRKYMRGASEMFAEAYGQYRTEPALTKKTMPKLFAYFEKIGGEK